MLIKEVIQGFRDVVADRSSKISDDTSFSDRLLYHYLKMCRSKLLYDKYVTGRRPINKFSTQSLGCIALKEIDPEECPCKPMHGCIYLRSKDPLPQTILITDVRTGSIPTQFDVQSKDGIRGSVEFNYIKWEDIPSVCDSRFDFDKKEKFFSLKTRAEGTYLYIHNNIFFEHVDVEGMFEEPLDVPMYPSCCDPNECVYAPEERFPLDSDLLGTLYMMTFEKYISIKQASGTDILNNDSDEVSGANPQIK